MGLVPKRVRGNKGQINIRILHDLIVNELIHLQTHITDQIHPERGNVPNRLHTRQVLVRFPYLRVH